MTTRSRVSQGAIEASKRVFRLLGLDVRRAEPDDEAMVDASAIFRSLVKLRDAPPGQGQDDLPAFLRYCAASLHLSRAQIFQDLFVLFVTHEKSGGYFVEFGATDGVGISNTFLLETEYAWNGVLAEPARRWQDALRKNRRCKTSDKCVWRTSGERLTFNETDDGELSTLDEFSQGDFHSGKRVGGSKYEVETISLLDLLDSVDAPRTIDYVSIDTEGSEFEILSAFDFSRYDIRIITVEHNHGPTRARVFDLLAANGYQRRFTRLSRWEDWFVKA